MQLTQIFAVAVNDLSQIYKFGFTVIVLLKGNNKKNPSQEPKMQPVLKAFYNTHTLNGLKDWGFD